jgi:O-antigen ligase/polysaccharide polymerase Wzy-like membrane protein
VTVTARNPAEFEFASIREPDAPIPSTLFCIAWFAAAAICVQFGAGLIVYVAALGWSSFRSLRRPIEGLWLLFFAFAVAVMSVPLDYNPEFGSESPRAYFYWGFAIVCVACAMSIGSLLKPRRFQDEKRSGVWGAPFLLFLGVVLLAAVYGYLRGNGLGTIVRQGSGLIFLFLFILFGYSVRPSFRELSTSLRNIETVLVAYAGAYLVQEVYVNLALRFALPDGDFFRERSPILFFCGLFAALELGRWIFRGKRWMRPQKWLSLSLLLASTVLSGSRSIVASMLLTTLFFVVLRYARHPLRIALLVVCLVVAGTSLDYQGLLSQAEIQSPFVQHIVDRYMVSPDRDLSFLERSSQMNAIWEGLKSRPLFGDGVGASLVWFDPYNRGYVETAFVDSGVGYLLLKMGLVGVCTFLLFLISLLRQSWLYWKSTHHEIFLVLLGMLTYYSAYLPFGPSFFQFLTSFWVGILIGYLHLLHRRGQEDTWPAALQPRANAAS